MRLRVFGMGLLAALAIGCASSVKLENESRVHSLRADAAASGRDYSVAASEKAEAERLHQKAMKRAYKEGRNDVIVPADVAAPVTP